MSDYYYSSSDEYEEVTDYHGYLANQKLENERMKERRKESAKERKKRDFNTVTQGLIDGKFFIGTKPHVYASRGYTPDLILRDTKTREELVHFNITEDNLRTIQSEFLRKHKE
jgi:hypothetical protein